MVTDQLYRRNQDGMMVEIVPEARGKAAAISRLLSQGGTPFKMSQRYKKGKFKGLTVDEATARAEAMWESSPDALKQRYADRTSGPTTDLAPSERIATPAPPRAAAVAPPAVTQRPMQLPGGSNITQGPPSPETSAALARRAQAPAAAVAPSYNGARTDISPLAQREVAKRQAAVAATPTGAPVMSEKGAALSSVATGGTVNRLTGLSVGFQPGDKLPNGADTAMATRAAESLKRQEVATSKAAIAPPAPRPVPSVAPARPPTYLSQSQINRPQTVTTGVEARAAAEMRRQAGINANPSTVNPDDPKKFFTGKRKPLTQLVASRA
jgi:hypothetical protein